MAREDILRLPIIYLLSALGAGVGFYMVYVHGPLEDEVSSLRGRVNVLERESAGMKSDIRHLEEKP
jgi:hypothetical protein